MKSKIKFTLGLLMVIIPLIYCIMYLKIILFPGDITKEKYFILLAIRSETTSYIPILFGFIGIAGAILLKEK